MYDLIGDIHGHAKPLIRLLDKLGYSRRDGYYTHPKRQVIFVGDFIDRGNRQRQVLEIVMPMVTHGSALAVMGNHEFNALAFHTPDASKPGSWLRPRDDKNIKQHLAFLREYLGTKNQAQLEEALAFFRSLPLWLDLPGLRVVHACWDPASIERLSMVVAENNTLTDRLFVDANNESHETYQAVETLLKGREIDLPAGCFFHDKDGNERREARIRWWLNEDTPLGDAALPPGTVTGEQASQAISKDYLGGYASADKPVFFGHYWLTGCPRPLSSNAMCLDYSVARGGKLVAYCWRGEAILKDENLVWVDVVEDALPRLS